MKKYFITIVLLLVCSVGFCDERIEDVTWDSGNSMWNEDQSKSQALGIYVGFAQEHMREHLSLGGETSTKNTVRVNGVQIGLLYETTFVKGLGMGLGLNYTFGSDANNDWEVASFTSKQRSKIFYHGIDIHADLQYKFRLAQNTYMGFYTGPTFQAQLSLKEKKYEKLLDGEPSLTSTINYFSTKEDPTRGMGQLAYRQCNLAWGVGFILQFYQFFLRGGYDFGIISAFKNDYYHVSEDYSAIKIYSRFDQWQIRLGMYLWQR